MKSRRSAVVTLDVVMASVVLGGLLLVSVQMIAAASTQRRLADERRWAALAVDSVLERLAARSLAELDDPPETLPEEVARLLPGAELKVVVDPPAGTPPARRVTVSLRLQDRDGRFLAPVTVTTWKYPGDRQAPAEARP